MAFPVSHEDSVPNAVTATRPTEADRPEFIPVEADNRQAEVIDRAIAKLHRNLGLQETRLSRASSSMLELPIGSLTEQVLTDVMFVRQLP